MCWPYRVWTDFDVNWFQDHIQKCHSGEQQPLTSDAWCKSLKDCNHHRTQVNKCFGCVAKTALKHLVIEKGMVLEEICNQEVLEETCNQEIMEEVWDDNQKKKKDKGKSKNMGRDKSKDASMDKGKSKGKSKGKEKGKSKGKEKGKDMDMDM
jgi:flagellar biosynthesis/type III secretory pathway protein FliH